VACRRVLSSALLQLVGSSPVVAFGNETYKLRLLLVMKLLLYVPSASIYKISACCPHYLHVSLLVWFY
jgi:hypothetical protein